MKVFDTIWNSTARTRLKLEKAAPQLLVASGIVGFVLTAISASKATVKAVDIVDEHLDMMQKIKEAEKICSDETKVEELVKKNPNKEEEIRAYDARADRLHQWAVTGGKLVLAYTPSVALAALSTACILTGYRVLNSRYVGAVAAFNAVSEAFQTYRGRVIAEQGEAMDRHFRYGTILETREVKEKDENGNEVTRTELVEKTDVPKDGSLYAKVFDEGNVNWDRNPTFTMMFLRAQQKIANDMLHARGHLFLNEVYDMLGFEHTPIGAVTGWILGEGDDYVDFGFQDFDRDDTIRFINGEKNYVLLDFNVDGVIWDKI